MEGVGNKVVLVIGNGFDLDLERRTSYKDFCNSRYCPSAYPAPLIQHLNDRWPDKVGVRWYDLENELLAYRQLPGKKDVVTDMEKQYLNENDDYNICMKRHFGSVDDVLTELIRKGIVILDGLNVQVPYRKDLQASFVERDKKAFELIKIGLARYLNSQDVLVSSRSTVAYSMLDVLDRAGVSKAIYSFNYTPLPTPFDSKFKTLFHYVHGSCSSQGVVIGTSDFVDDDEDYDFFQKSFDPYHNPPALLHDLLDAKEVIIFGHSLGTNDSPYFEDFFMIQSKPNAPRKKVTIVTKDSDSEIEVKRSLEKLTLHRLTNLRALNELQIIKTDDCYGGSTEILRDFFKSLCDDDACVESVVEKCHRWQ